MSRLKSHTEQIAQDLSHQHGFSIEAVRHMIRAIDAGWGRMASFEHPEFGGPGSIPGQGSHFLFLNLQLLTYEMHCE